MPRERLETLTAPGHHLARHWPVPSMPTTVPTTAEISSALERAARRAAPAIALLITTAVLLARLAYELGYQLGSAIHHRSAQLARLHAALSHRQVSAPATPQPILHPLATLAADLEQLTTRQLRQLTGIQRKLSKRQLIALALAC